MEVLQKQSIYVGPQMPNTCLTPLPPRLPSQQDFMDSKTLLQVGWAQELQEAFEWYPVILQRGGIKSNNPKSLPCLLETASQDCKSWIVRGDRVPTSYVR